MGYGREREMQFASRRDLKKRDEWKTTHKGCRIAFDPTKRARPAQRFDRRTGSKRFPNINVCIKGARSRVPRRIEPDKNGSQKDSVSTAVSSA